MKRHAHPGGHEALDRLVVVGVEGDARLEARRLAGAQEDLRCPGRCPATSIQDPRLARRSSSRRCAAPASAWPAGSRTNSGSSSTCRCSSPSCRPASRPGPSAARCPSPALQRAHPVLGLGEDHRQLDGRVALAEARDGQRHERRARGREGGDAQRGRRAGRRSPRARPRRRRGARGWRRRAARAPRPASVRRTPRGVALDERGARLALERGDLLRDGGLRVGEGLGAAEKEPWAATSRAGRAGGGRRASAQLMPTVKADLFVLAPANRTIPPMSRVLSLPSPRGDPGGRRGVVIRGPWPRTPPTSSACAPRRRAGGSPGARARRRGRRRRPRRARGRGGGAPADPFRATAGSWCCSGRERRSCAAPRRSAPAPGACACAGAASRPRRRARCERRPPADRDRGPRALRVWAALGAVYLIWGSTYLAIRVMVDGGVPRCSGRCRASPSRASCCWPSSGRAGVGGGRARAAGAGGRRDRRAAAGRGRQRSRHRRRAGRALGPGGAARRVRPAVARAVLRACLGASAPRPSRWPASAVGFAGVGLLLLRRPPRRPPTAGVAARPRRRGLVGGPLALSPRLTLPRRSARLDGLADARRRPGPPGRRAGRGRARRRRVGAVTRAPRRPSPTSSSPGSLVAYTAYAWLLQHAPLARCRPTPTSTRSSPSCWARSCSTRRSPVTRRRRRPDRRGGRADRHSPTIGCVKQREQR